MNKESEILDGGIGVGHLIVDSPASSLRRTTSALLTNIKHRYDADDVCIDCGYDDGERYMQPQQNTNPTRMMLRSAERKGYENALRDAVEAIKAFGALSQYRKELGDDGYPIFWLESVDAVAAIQALGGKQ